MKIKSYAKINLCLKVYHKEPHELKHQIDSIFYLYKKLYDVIKIKPSKSLSIKYLFNGQEVVLPDCLISKCLQYLHNKYNFDINYEIVVDKHIPIGSGLGGASSNAACVINYVLKHNNPISLDLKEIALTLGSDIPFFLYSYEVARVKRYGEYVSPLQHIDTEFELINTNILCSTKEVFALFDQNKIEMQNVDIDNIFNNLINKQHLNVVYNNLTECIIKSNIKLQEWLDKNPGSWFSGSGGTLVKIKEK